MNKSIEKTSNGSYCFKVTFKELEKNCSIEFCCFKVAFKELEKNCSIKCWMLSYPKERTLEKMLTTFKFCKSSIYLKEPYSQFEWFPNLLHVKF